jgi:hypothetical protein
MAHPLTDVLPDAVRKRLYAVAFVALVVFSAFQAADGDWKQFTGGVLGTLVTLLATANTSGTVLPKVDKGEGGHGDPIFFVAIAALLIAVLAICGVRIG